MIHPVVLFYALCCATTIWFAAHSRRDDRFDALAAAFILTAGCLLSNIAYFAHAIGNWVRIDAAVMLLLLWLAWRTLRAWKLVLAGLAVATMGVHALVEWLDDRSLSMMYAYPAALNALFVLELLTVASNGARGTKDAGSVWMVFARFRDPGRDSDCRGRSANEPE